jgi:hypothetical protein
MKSYQWQRRPVCMCDMCANTEVGMCIRTKRDEVKSSFATISFKVCRWYRILTNVYISCDIITLSIIFSYLKQAG